MLFSKRMDKGTLFLFKKSRKRTRKRTRKKTIDMNNRNFNCVLAENLGSETKEKRKAVCVALYFAIAFFVVAVSRVLWEWWFYVVAAAFVVVFIFVPSFAVKKGTKVLAVWTRPFGATLPSLIDWRRRESFVPPPLDDQPEWHVSSECLGVFSHLWFSFFLVAAVVAPEHPAKVSGRKISSKKNTCEEFACLILASKIFAFVLKTKSQSTLPRKPCCCLQHIFWTWTQHCSECFSVVTTKKTKVEKVGSFVL